MQWVHSFLEGLAAVLDFESSFAFDLIGAPADFRCEVSWEEAVPFETALALATSSCSLCVAAVRLSLVTIAWL